MGFIHSQRLDMPWNAECPFCGNLFSIHSVEVMVRITGELVDENEEETGDE